MKRTFTKADFEGVGVYQRLDREPRVAEEYQWGIYAKPGMGQVPGQQELLAPLLDVEEQSGLVAIANDKRPLAVATLDMMTFAPEQPPPADPVTGQASFVIVSAGGKWVEDFAAAGYMVMVNLASVSSMNPRMMMTQNPETIVQYARRGGGYAMVTGPQALAVQASQLATAPATPPSCPAGSVWSATMNQCTPASAAHQPADAGTSAPGWLWPVAIGAGVLAVGLIVLR